MKNFWSNYNKEYIFVKYMLWFCKCINSNIWKSYAIKNGIPTIENFCRIFVGEQR